MNNSVIAYAANQLNRIVYLPRVISVKTQPFERRFEFIVVPSVIRNIGDAQRRLRSQIGQRAEGVEIAALKTATQRNRVISPLPNMLRLATVNLESASIDLTREHRLHKPELTVLRNSKKDCLLRIFYPERIVQS